VTASPSSAVTNPPATSRLSRCGPLLIAALTLAVILASGERGLFEWRIAEAPGITLDEGFNVATGVYLVRNLEANGLGSIHPATIREVYGSPNYNPDHPPLGRWAIGFVHEWLGCPDNVPFAESSARPASAIAFALTVLLVGGFIQKWHGRLAGCVSAAAVALLPRQFAHAHLAALETWIGLTYALCVFIVADRCRPDDRRYRGFIWGGFAFGLGLLTKIQAVFLGPAIALWAVFYWRTKAIPRVALFGIVGLLVFFAGWPWLWLDPLKHLKDYFASTTVRQTLYCYYWGQRWADRDVPWHYPWVIFAVTTPLATHLLSLCGLFAGGVWRAGGVNPLIERRKTVDREISRLTPAARQIASDETIPLPTESPRRRIDPRTHLILWSIAIPLLVFTIPGIRVYDGERLFGVVFPLWAALAGIGAKALRDNWRIPNGILATSLTLAFATAVYRIAALNPCQLSYYNLITGGLSGADHLGFERSYWMEGLTDSFQREIVSKIPAGTRIDVAPVLHPVYLPQLLNQSPILQSAGIALSAYDDKQPNGSKYVLHFHRQADPWASLTPPPAGTKVIAELKRAEVPLVTLLKLP
jgi:4-amino-4-deoxy-L-arabinose transferase-like glycosyltransferase